MPVRNLAIERKMVDTFIKQRGKKPETSQDWAAVHKMTYPSITDLPDELDNTVTRSYYDSTENKLPQDPSQSDIGRLKNDVALAEKGMEDLSQPNSALRILQDAIKAKTGTKDRQIGESEIFKQAGVSGMGALDQSLSARGNEFKINQAEFSNIIGQMAGTYKDMAGMALNKYNSAINLYNTEVGRLQKIMDDAKQQEQAIKLLQIKHDLDLELEDYKKKNPSISEQLGAEAAGYDINNGNILKKGAGVITSPDGSSYDITSYATDPNHEKSVNSIMSGIGKFETITDVANYIHKVAPDSPITADMIVNASEEYGVSWESMVAMMQQDSSLGTAGKGARTFNPGNVGNNDRGDIVNYGDWQSGVNAVAKWLSNHKVANVNQNVEEKDYKQYGLIANTSFDPSNESDKFAKAYLDYYIKNSSIPSSYQIGLGTRTSGSSQKFADAQSRAQQLYYEATGSSLPDVKILSETKKLITENNKILNKNEIQADTIIKNFDLAIKGEIKDDVNMNATIVNRILNPIYLALGDPAVNQALVSNGTISQEFANLISIRNASGTTVADKEMASELIRFGTSVEAQKAVVERLKQEAANIHSALEGQNTKLYKIIDPLETETNNPNRQSSLSGTEDPLGVR